MSRLTVYVGPEIGNLHQLPLVGTVCETEPVRRVGWEAQPSMRMGKAEAKPRRVVDRGRGGKGTSGQVQDDVGGSTRAEDEWPRLRARDDAFAPHVCHGQSSVLCSEEDDSRR